MKYIFIGMLVCSAGLVACGSDSSASAKVVTEHFFEQAYECRREREVTSKRTGKVRTVKYITYYSPAKGWRIDLTDVGANSILTVANLYTPTARYDGAFDERDGIIRFGTAWPYAEAKPGVSLGHLSKSNKNNCNILNDSSVFDINYLDELEIKGQ